MEVKDIVEIISIVVTAIASIIALVISVYSIKISNKAYIESKMPSIHFYLDSIEPSTMSFHYAILKNTGQSSALITDIVVDNEPNVEGPFSFKEIFSNVIGTSLGPGQKIQSIILFKDPSQAPNFNVVIKYEYLGKKFEESFDFSPSKFSKILSSKATSKNKELEVIANVLQEIAIRDL